MVSDPFGDIKDKGLQVYSRGQIDFLKMGLKNAAGSPVAIDADFATYDTVIVIKDPDGADVTATWATNDLDPNDSADDWDENKDDNEGKYMGDEHAPAYVGLFWNLFNRAAQKIKVPAGAEVTVGGSREWHVYWQLRHNGVIIPLTDEPFNVDAAAVVDFGGTSVTPDEIRARVQTALGNDEINAIIFQATRRVHGKLRNGGIDPDTFVDLPETVKDVIVGYSLKWVFIRDISAGLKPVEAKEGDSRVKFGNNLAIAQEFATEADTDLQDYIRNNSTKYKPRLRVSRRNPMVRND